MSPLTATGVSDVVARGNGEAKMISPVGIEKEGDTGDWRNFVSVPSVLGLGPVMGSKGLTNGPIRAVDSFPRSVSH